MALAAIASAISAGVQRNVEISTLKHEDKIQEVRMTLARSAATRLDTHAEKLTKARLEHATWVSTLQGAALECYKSSRNELEAIGAHSPS